jgi:glycosyltransferase involved in cell wall biosynthesis
LRAEILRHGPGIRVTGEVADIRPLVAKNAVYVGPIHDGGGTRLKILDAMAQGIPLVATTMAVEGIGIRTAEHALIADDAAAFAQHVVEVFRKPEFGRRLADAAYDLVAGNYSWESIGHRLRSVYELARDALREGENESISKISI